MSCLDIYRKGILLSTAARVAEFHKLFGHPVREEAQVIPTKAEAHLAFLLILEELDELADALFDGSVNVVANIHEDGIIYNPDLVAIADAIGDLDYVVNGAGIRHGLNMDSLGKEIHESNLSKLDENGNPIISRGVELDGKPAGKILKSDQFFEPNIAKAIGL